ELIEFFADKRQILYIEESDIEHVTDDHCRAACLHDLKHAHVHRFPAYGFDDRQHNVTTVENWNRQHVQNRKVHIQNHAEPQRELPTAFALKKQIVNTTDPDGTAQMLQFHVRLRRGNCADRLQRAGHAVVNLLDWIRVLNRNDSSRVPLNSYPGFLFAIRW